MWQQGDEGESGGEQSPLFGRYRRNTGGEAKSSMAEMWGFEDEGARREARRKRFWAATTEEEPEPEDPWAQFHHANPPEDAAPPEADYEQPADVPTAYAEAEEVPESRGGGWRNFLATNERPSAPGSQPVVERVIERSSALLSMDVMLDLRPAATLCARIGERWQGLEPTVADIVIRALAHALAREEQFGGEVSIVLVDPGMDPRSGVLLERCAAQSFRTLVTTIAKGRPDPVGDAAVTFIDYGAMLVEKAIPRLGNGTTFAVSLGTRTFHPAQTKTGDLEWVPSAWLTVAYDADRVSDAVAARIVSRLRSLVAAPMQLLKEDWRQQQAA